MSREQILDMLTTTTASGQSEEAKARSLPKEAPFLFVPCGLSAAWGGSSGGGFDSSHRPARSSNYLAERGEVQSISRFRSQCPTDNSALSD